ncbi:hypothetical protein [Nonomuraea sp. NPDC003214]
MTPETVDRLRAEASRDDYPSMARLARALHEAGHDRREVLRECYGVTFPEELFVVVDGGMWRLELRARFTNQPWQPAVPPDRGGPAATANSMNGTELRLLAEDPDLMPLFGIPAVLFDTPDQVVCYRLSELREGRSTVFRLPGTAPAAKARHCGASMLEVLHREHLQAVRRAEKQLSDPRNWGAGSVDDEEVAEEYAALERVRELRRRVAERAEG